MQIELAARLGRLSALDAARKAAVTGVGFFEIAEPNRGRSVRAAGNRQGGEAAGKALPHLAIAPKAAAGAQR